MNLNKIMRLASLALLFLLYGTVCAAEGDLAVNGNLTVGTQITFPGSSVQTTAFGPGAYVKVSDVKPSGTCSQAVAAGRWNTRNLNTTDNDVSGIAILDSNQITLMPGTYVAHIYAPFYAAGAGPARLQNVTDGITIINGTSIYGAPGVGVVTYSVMMGMFTITANKHLEVQQYFSGAPACPGGTSLGIPGRNEVYTVAEFWKVQ